MKNIKILLSYDGTGLSGWQKTSLGPSVEEHLETVLFQIFQEEISLQAASRTDAGVHAEGQVVNFLLRKNYGSLGKLHKSINALLPSQIRVLSIEEASPSFHPTLDNRGKQYQYFVCNDFFQKPKHRLFSWHFPYSLDIDTMKSGASLLLGTHDFSSFCNERSLSQKSPICTIQSLEITPLHEKRFCFTVEGDRFLFRMVRNLVGTLLYVGCGKIKLSDLPHLLHSRSRALAGVTAPAHGLHLMEVFYS